MTIIEVLENAEHNLGSANERLAGVTGFAVALGREQLHNAVVLLLKGYDPYDDVSDLIERHNPIETAPEKEL